MLQYSATTFPIRLVFHLSHVKVFWDTEAAKEPNLVSKFSRQILQNFPSEPMRTTSFPASTHMTVY